jgi:hypothetical protein
MEPPFMQKHWQPAAGGSLMQVNRELVNGYKKQLDRDNRCDPEEQDMMMGSQMCMYPKAPRLAESRPPCP